MFAIETLSFMADGEYYAADVTRVHKVARKLTVTPVPAAPPEVTGITGINGKAVTLLSIAALLYGAEADAAKIISGQCSAVIFKQSQGDEYKMGFVIEKPGEFIRFDSDKISPPKSRHVLGVAEDRGVLYRIIDIDSIINRYRDAEG